MNRWPSLLVWVWVAVIACTLLVNTAWASRRLATIETDGYESIAHLGARYGFPAPSVDRQSVTLKSKYTTMVFSTNRRKLIFNGMLVWLNGPVVSNRGKWSIARVDVVKTIEPLLLPSKHVPALGSCVVMLDPGHGGNDAGAIGHRKVYEKKVVLDISKRARSKLADAGVAVKMTRDDDSYLGLSARTALAKDAGADIFVSIHVNSAHDSRASGMETFVMPAAGFPSTAGNNSSRIYPGNKHDAANMLLAYSVQKEMLKNERAADRGIRRARFDVLRSAPCPAILVECGFVSNRLEEEKMLQAAYRENMAEAITQGILAYIAKAGIVE